MYVCCQGGVAPLIPKNFNMIKVFEDCQETFFKKFLDRGVGQRPSFPPLLLQLLDLLVSGEQRVLQLGLAAVQLGNQHVVGRRLTGQLLVDL